MNDNLPPLPEPKFHLNWRDDEARYTVSKPNIGSTDVFTEEQMREYGQLCRQQAIEEAAELCDNIPTLYGLHSCFIASKKIKEIK